MGKKYIAFIAFLSLLTLPLIVLDVPRALATDCPPNWHLTLKTPGQIGLHTNTHIPIKEYSNSVTKAIDWDLSGILVSKLANYSEINRSVNVNFESSLDGVNFVENPPVPDVFIMELKGYFLRTHVEIATSDCPTPFSFYSQIDKINPASVNTATLDQIYPTNPFQINDALQQWINGCKEYYLASASSGKMFDQNQVPEAVNNENGRKWGVAGGCAFLLASSIGPQGGGLFPITFFPTDQSQCLNYSSRTPYLLNGPCDVGVFAQSAYLNQLLWYQIDSFSIPKSPQISAQPTQTPAGASSTPTTIANPKTITKRVVVLKWTCVKGASTLKFSGKVKACPSGYKIRK